MTEDYSDYEATENLLELAEDIKKICDNYVDKLETLVILRDTILSFLGFCYCLFLVISYFYINSDYYAWNNNLKFFEVYIASSCLLFFVVLIVTIPLNSRINNIYTKLNYEQNVLIETVDLVRERIIDLPLYNDWTKIKNIEFKIRLSRFNTGRYKMLKSVLKEILSLFPNFNT